MPFYIATPSVFRMFLKWKEEFYRDSLRMYILILITPTGLLLVVYLESVRCSIVHVYLYIVYTLALAVFAFVVFVYLSTSTYARRKLLSLRTIAYGSLKLCHLDSVMLWPHSSGLWNMY